MAWGEVAAPAPVETGAILVPRGYGWGWMSLGRDLGLSLITHKNATLAESRPVSLAGSTTKKMLFPSTVTWSRYTSRPWETWTFNEKQIVWTIGADDLLLFRSALLLFNTVCWEKTAYVLRIIHRRQPTIPRDLRLFLLFILKHFLKVTVRKYLLAALYCICVRRFFCTLKILACPWHSPRIGFCGLVV